MQIAEVGQTTSEKSIRDYVGVLIRRKWLVVSIIAASLIIVGIYSLLAPPTYESASAVVVRTTNNTSQFPSIGAADRSRFQRQPDAELEYVQSTLFVNAASAASPPSTTVEVAYDGDGTQRRSSQLVFVAEAPNAVDAELAAAAWAEYYLEIRAQNDVDEINASIASLTTQIDDLEQEKAEILEPIKPIDDALLVETDSDTISRLTTQRLSLRQSVEDELLPISLQLRTLSQELSTLRIASGYAERPDNSARLSIAATPAEKVAPRPFRNLALAGVLSVLLAGAAAFLLDGWRSVIREPSDIDALGSGFPVLARLPEFPRDTTDPLALAADSTSLYAQAVERVVSALLYRKVALDRERLSVLFTSSIPAEGKTSVSSHIARRLGSSANRTILIDADLRRPDVVATFRVEPNGHGFAELLATRGSLPEHLLPVAGASHLRLMPTFAGTDNAAQLLRQEFEPAVASLEGEYEMLLIDAPPVLAVTDAEIMAHSVDAVVVVVRAGRTTRVHLSETLAKLRAANAEIAGFVLVGARNTAASGYAYSYSYEPAAAVPAPMRSSAVQAGPVSKDPVPVGAASARDADKGDRRSAQPAGDRNEPAPAVGAARSGRPRKTDAESASTRPVRGRNPKGSGDRSATDPKADQPEVAAQARDRSHEKSSKSDPTDDGAARGRRTDEPPRRAKASGSKGRRRKRAGDAARTSREKEHRSDAPPANSPLTDSTATTDRTAKADSTATTDRTAKADSTATTDRTAKAGSTATTDRSSKSDSSGQTEPATKAGSTAKTDRAAKSEHDAKSDSSAKTDAKRDAVQLDESGFGWLDQALAKDE